MPDAYRRPLCTLSVAVLLCAAPAAAQQAAAEPGPPPEAQLEAEAETEPDVVDVVVTGTRVRTAPFDTAADVEVISGERVHPTGGKSFRDSLTGVTGVKLNNRGEDPTFSGLEVRGLSTNATSGANVLVLLDGFPQRRLSFGGPYMGSLPYEAVHRIEVVKGPLSSQYGRGSLAGAVQLFSHPGREHFGARVRMIHERVTDTQRGSVSVYGPIPHAGETTFSLTGSATVSNGWQPRAATRRGDVYLHVRSYLTLRDRVDLTAGYFDAAEQSVAPVLIDASGERLPGISRDANLAIPEQNALDIEEKRFGVVYTHSFSPTFELEVKVGRWSADTSWKVGRPSDAPESGTVVTRAARNLDWEEESWLTEIQLQESYEVGSAVAGVVTGGVTAETLRWDSTVQSIAAEGATFAEGVPIDLATMDEPQPSTWTYGPATTRVADEIDRGVFLSDTTTLFDRVTLQAGFRYDHYRRSQRNQATGNQASVSDSAFSPAAGAVVHVLGGARRPFGLNLYGSWGRGFSPVFRAVSNTEIVDVDPETSESVEVGVKVQGWRGRLSSKIAAYQLDRNDVVGWDPDTQTQDNVGDWRIRGVEISGRARVSEPLSVFVGGTLRRTRIERDASNPANEGNEIPFVAGAMARAGIRYAPRQGLGGDASLRVTDESYADDANRVRLPGSWLVDASVSYRWREMQLAWFVKNLLDDDYYSAVFMGVRNGSAFAATPRTYGMSIALEY